MKKRARDFSPMAVIVRAIHAGHHRAQASGLPIGEPVVDGRGAGDGEEAYVDLLGLVRGISAEAWTVCEIMVLEVARDRHGDVIRTLRNGAWEVRELDEHQIGKRLGMPPRRVRALRRGALRQVCENYHRRQEADVADAMMAERSKRL